MNWDDEQQVLEQAKNSIYGIRDASPRLKNNLPFLLKAVKGRITNFNYASEELQNNEILYNTVKKTILSQPMDLRYIPKKFKDDKEIILKAVKDYYGNFEYASDRLKQDEDIIRTTLKSIPSDRLSFSEDFIKSMDIQNPYLILDTFKEQTFVINYLNEKLKSDKTFMLNAIKLNPYFFLYADDSLKNDRMFIIDAININPDIRIMDDKIPLELRQDPEIVKDENRQITKVKLRGVPLNLFFFNISKEEILIFRKNLKETIQLIKSSKIPNFSDVLNGNIYIGTREDLILNFGGSGIDENVGAYYIEKIGVFYILPTKIGSVSTLIHELAHKYHDTLIKDGYRNYAIMQFFRFSQYRECSFPQVGDPLSDLREDWWIVKKMASDEYYLKRILSNNAYEYENKNKDKKVIPYGKMIELINCPSQYGAKNHKEFVAELCTLITLNKMKSSMQKLADDFIRMLEEEI